MDEQIEAAIDFLRRVQLRPEMHSGNLDPMAMIIFLEGFASGLRIVGPDVLGMFSPMSIRRGWTDPHGPIPAMREKGMSDREIVTELVEIAIETLRYLQKTL